MTSSAKQTRRTKASKASKASEASEASEASKASQASNASQASRAVKAEASSRPMPPIPHVDLVVGATLVLSGWILIAYVNRWHLGAPVFFLCVGWLAILLVGKWLWSAGIAAAEMAQQDEGFVVTSTRREELVREKKTLLKAIKEVEFDHQLGKMSDTDAEEITRFYRVRAIEIIKRLERIDRGEEQADGDLTVQEKIERELRARMTVLGSTAKGERQAAVKKEKVAAKKAKASKATATEAEAEAETEAEEAREASS